MKPNLRDFKHICILQTAFIGDVILSLPLVEVIRKNHPDAKISFVSTPVSAGITSGIPSIDSIITYDKRGIRRGFDGIRHTAQLIKEFKTDLIISCHRSFRSTLLCVLLKPIHSVGFDNASFSILHSSRVEYLKNKHEIERNLELLKAFNDYEDLVIDDHSVNFDISYQDRMFVDGILLSNAINPNKLVSIFPGSIWPTKRWKKEHFSALIIKLKNEGFECILNGSEDDASICSEIAQSTGAKSFCGMLSLAQSVYLISLSKLLVTNDSAPSHMANLVRTPTLTIFGPTSPIFGFAPRALNSRNISLEELSCRPCEIHGNVQCPIGTHDCMEKLMPEDVLKSCFEIIGIKPVKSFE
jgi:heptosyltransferase-2